MNRHHDVRTKQTIETINRIHLAGHKKIGVLIRHSERFYPEETEREPFMGLTDPGKKYAHDLGTQLPPSVVPQLYSSPLGRCIETAYLIDKGFTSKTGISTSHNQLNRCLAPFYVKDIKKAMDLVNEIKSMQFLRQWFDNQMSEEMMEHPVKTADKICGFMVDRLKALKTDQIAICVSHDWNIFPIKEFKMNLRLEESGDVGYLDSVVFFENNHHYYLASYQTDSVKLEF